MFSCLVGLYRKQYRFVFQIHLFKKPLPQPDGSLLLNEICSFYTKFSKKWLFNANTSKKHCELKFGIAYHDGKVCFLPKCRDYDIPVGEIKHYENSYNIRTQTGSAVNTWTVYIHFSSINPGLEPLSRVDMSLILCRRQLISTNKTKKWRGYPVSQKGDSWRKSTEKLWLSSFQKTIFELELITIADCFLDDHGF